MSEPKNQHIIPKCYLKQFVDPNVSAGQEAYVWIFDRGSTTGKRRAPKNILTETDLYTFEGGDGVKDYSLEKTLSQIESEYATVFDLKLSRKLPLNRSEHIVLCAFVAAMLQRTIKQKEHIEHFYDQLISVTEGMETAHGLAPKTSLELRQAKDNAHKMAIVQSVPEITNILLRMNLAFLCADRRSSFITSDAPCFLFNAELQWQRFYGPGLAQKNVEVRMPLSPEISLSFTWANNLRGYLVIDEDLVHEHNRMVYGYSHEHFIANSPKVKREWFRRFPLDPVFIARIVKNKMKSGLENRFKRYGRSR
jgi:Protein of unknown function (DUF4238)